MSSETPEKDESYCVTDTSILDEEDEPESLSVNDKTFASVMNQIGILSSPTIDPSPPHVPNPEDLLDFNNPSATNLPRLEHQASQMKEPR